MKLRLLVVFVFAALFLASCSMAEDITPPPDYSAATPAPVVEVTYPSGMPSVESGAAIYEVECASCHGVTGLGNGELASQMPVAVPAIGLREISSQATPADWYLILTEGSVSRGMPSYASLSVEDRWDLLAYTYSLSTTAEQIDTGAALYAANCAECHGATGNQNPSADFTDPVFMAQRSGTGMYRQVSEGGSTMPAFGSLLAEDEIFALTDYVRSLSFSEPLTAVTAASADPTPTEEPVVATSEPVADATDVPVAADSTSTPELILLTLSGHVSTGDGSALEPGLPVELHQYDMNTGAELDAIPGEVASDGTFLFADIAITADSQLAYWASVDYQGVPYSSDFATYDGSTTTFDMPVTIYEATSDYTLLKVPQLEGYFLFDTEGVVQVFQFYRFVNDSGKTIVFPIPDSTIPFIQTPEGAQDLQFSPGSNTAPFMTADDGVAMLPGPDLVYEIVTIYTLPYEKRLSLEIPFALPADSVVLYIEEGIKVKSKALTEVGPTAIQEINFVEYDASDVAAGDSIALTMSGSISASDTTTPILDKKLIIIIGIAGLLLIAAGLFLFVRERRRALDEEELLGDEEEEGEDALGDDPEAIMDAIIVLDDQYKAGDISKEAYEQRREELKSRLKEQ